MPSMGQVHYDEALTTISVGYALTEKALFARRVFPVVPVAKESGVYFTIPKGQMFSDTAKRRAPGTRAARGDYTRTTAPYACERFAFAHDIPDPVRANWTGAGDADESGVKLVTNKMIIRENLRFVSAFMRTGVWATDLTGVASAPGAGQFLQWDQAGSTPISDIRRRRRIIKRATNLAPNVLACGGAVFDALMNHASILARLPTTIVQIAADDEEDTALLARILGVKEVVVLDGSYNSADEGQAAVMTDFVQTTALLAYKPDSPSLDTPSAGYVFSWSDGIGDVGDMIAANGGAGIKKYRNPEAEESDAIEANAYSDLRPVSTDCAAFFDSAVAAVT